MRRFARRVSTLCSAASLLLCAATLLFWFSSYRTTRQVSVVRPPHSVWLDSSDGVVRLTLGNSTGETWPAEYVSPAGWAVEAWPTPDRSDGSVWEELQGGVLARAGFHVQRARFVSTVASFGPVTYRTGDRVYVPYWLLLFAFAAPLGFAGGRAARRRRRARRRRCASCGYDLRATPGRCPECGAVPAPVKGTT